MHNISRKEQETCQGTLKIEWSKRLDGRIIVFSTFLVIRLFPRCLDRLVSRNDERRRHDNPMQQHFELHIFVRISTKSSWPRFRSILSFIHTRRTKMLFRISSRQNRIDLVINEILSSLTIAHVKLVETLEFDHRVDTLGQINPKRISSARQQPFARGLDWK